jgi:hypothetical protein
MKGSGFGPWRSKVICHLNTCRFRIKTSAQYSTVFDFADFIVLFEPHCFLKLGDSCANGAMHVISFYALPIVKVIAY